MQNKREWNPILLKYYIGGFIPPIFLYLLFYAYNVPLIDIMFFSIPYFWNMTLMAPGIDRRLAIRKYRFSFLRLIYKLDNYLIHFFKEGQDYIKKRLMKNLPPFLMVVVLHTISNNGNIMFAVVGIIVFELILVVFRRLRLL